jgi:CII-binding regulator of phage lambda lysogenization HflD
VDLKDIALWYSGFTKDYGPLVKSVYAGLLLLAGWLLKKGNQKYKDGIKAGRDAGSVEHLEGRLDGHRDQIESLEDRVAKVEQSVSGCQAQRHELTKPLERLICAKLAALEKTIDAKMAGQRALAQEEKRREMMETREFIRDELERWLG